MNETLLVVFQAWNSIGNTKNKPKVFSTSTWEGGHFLCFSTFQIFHYRISKNVEVKILEDLFLITRKGHQTNVPSFIEIHETKWQRQ